MLCLRYMVLSSMILFKVLLITFSCSQCLTNCIKSTIQSSVEIFLTETNVIQKLQDDLEKEENQLKLDRQQLMIDKQIMKSVHPSDVIELNVGGKIIATTRQTLTSIPQSILATLFTGRWEYKLPIDDDENIQLDFHPTLFRHLLDQLQSFHSNNSIRFLPPSQRSLVEPFKKMLRKLGLHQLISSEKKNVLTFNVGGQTMTSRRTTLTAVSNSTYDTIVSSSTMINLNSKIDPFLDHDPNVFRCLIYQLRAKSFTNIFHPVSSSCNEGISFRNLLADLSIHRKYIHNRISA